MLIRYIFVLIVVFPLFNVQGQEDYNSDLVSIRNQIKQNNQDILALNKKLENAKRQESSAEEKITLIKEELALISRTKGLLEQQKRILEKRISETDRELRDTEERLRRLENLYIKRVRYAYKYGRIKNIELILKAESFNQALVRYKYLRAIAEQDERTIKNIREKRAKIQFLKSKLEKDLKTKENTINAKIAEERSYKNKRVQKQNLLKKLRDDQEYLKNQIKIKEKEQQKLNGWIVELERKRRLRKQRQDVSVTEPDYDFKDFESARGKLIWPVEGRIITSYGKQRDPISKTTINNTDIEIKSARGTPVKTVFDGAVRMITYLSSYGNTIIIDHGQGYYTVYSHLDEIYVNKGDFVRAGDIIATVGDSGSLAGPRLQFGIYGERKTYNPEHWLGSS